MERYPSAVERRWQIWGEVCAAVDTLDAALRRWKDADPELRHYIWLRRTNDLDDHPQQPGPPLTDPPDKP